MLTLLMHLFKIIPGVAYMYDGVSNNVLINLRLTILY